MKKCQKELCNNKKKKTWKRSSDSAYFKPEKQSDRNQTNSTQKRGGGRQFVMNASHLAILLPWIPNDENKFNNKGKNKKWTIKIKYRLNLRCEKATSSFLWPLLPSSLIIFTQYVITHCIFYNSIIAAKQDFLEGTLKQSESKILVSLSSEVCMCVNYKLRMLFPLSRLPSLSSCFMLSDEQAECFVDGKECSWKCSVEKDIKSFCHDHLRCSSAVRFSLNFSEIRHFG